MMVVIPPEFESFAREQVAAGFVMSEEEAVAAVLRGYLDDVEALRALLDPELEASDRNDTIDGDVHARTAGRDRGHGGGLRRGEVSGYRLTPGARQDLRDIRDRIARDRPQRAVTFTANFKDAGSATIHPNSATSTSTSSPHSHEARPERADVDR